MNGFIEIINQSGRRHFLNTRYINSVEEEDENSCLIYEDFGEEKYIHEVKESFETIKDKIQKSKME